MKKEFLESFVKEQIGKKVVFGDFSYELQKIGFEDIEDNGYDLKDILESGVCYYSFVEKIGINEENEELDGVKVRLEFEVLEWNTENESETQTLIKIIDCILEE